MINLIQKLHEYAEKRGLASAALEPHRINIRLVLNSSGFDRFELAGSLYMMPRQITRTGLSASSKPNHFFDSARFILGYDPVSPHKGLPSFQSFWTQLISDLTASGDVEASSAATAFFNSFEKNKSRILTQLNQLASDNPELKLSGDTWVAPSLDSDQFLIDRPASNHFWLQSFSKSQKSAPGEDVCCVTGESCTAALTHPFIKGVAGLPGAPFIAFNSEVSEYNGRKQGKNFPVSPLVALSYTSALNHILRSKPKNAIDLTSNSTLVMWMDSDTNGSDSLVSPILEMLNPWSKCTHGEAESVWKKVESLKNISDQVYVLILRSSQGRISVLEWSSIPLSTLAQNLLRFKDQILKEVNYSDNQTTFVSALVGQSIIRMPFEEFKITPILSADIYGAILFNKPMPHTIRTMVEPTIVHTPRESDPDYFSWRKSRQVRGNWLKFAGRRLSEV